MYVYYFMYRYVYFSFIQNGVYYKKCYGAIKNYLIIPSLYMKLHESPLHKALALSRP